MNKVLVYLVYGGVIVLAVIAAILIYKIVTNKEVAIIPAPSNRPVAATSVSPQPTPFPLPIDPNHPNLIEKPNEIDKGGSVVYTLSGVVDQITETGIALQSKGTPLPSFPIAKNTNVVKAATNQVASQPASLGDIKKGSNVTIQAVYNKNTSSWRIASISINP